MKIMVITIAVDNLITVYKSWEKTGAMEIRGRIDTILIIEVLRSTIILRRVWQPVVTCCHSDSYEKLTVSVRKTCQENPGYITKPSVN